MKTTAAIATCALFALAAPAFAQNTTTTTTPGHQMQQNGSTPGNPGASGYAPGHQNDDTGTTGGMNEGRTSAPDTDDMSKGASGSRSLNSGSQTNLNSDTGTSGTAKMSGSGMTGGAVK